MCEVETRTAKLHRKTWLSNGFHMNSIDCSTCGVWSMIDDWPSPQLLTSFDVCVCPALLTRSQWRSQNIIVNGRGHFLRIAFMTELWSTSLPAQCSRDCLVPPLCFSVISRGVNTWTEVTLIKWSRVIMSVSPAWLYVACSLTRVSSVCGVCVHRSVSSRIRVHAALTLHNQVLFINSSSIYRSLFCWIM